MSKGKTTQMFVPNGDRIWQGIQFVLLANIFIATSFENLFPDTIIWLETAPLSTLFALMVAVQLLGASAYYLLMPNHETDESLSKGFRTFMILHFGLLLVASAGYFLTYKLAYDFKVMIFFATLGYGSIGYAVPLMYLVKIFHTFLSKILRS